MLLLFESNSTTGPHIGRQSCYALTNFAFCFRKEGTKEEQLMADSPRKKKQRTEEQLLDKSKKGSSLPPVSVFIFRRDLRLTDNRALLALKKKNAATSPALPILPLFFFNPQQISPQLNPYYSPNCVEFMLQSLVDLNGPDQLGSSLVLLDGTDEQCLQHVSEAFDIQRIGFNKDITPFAKKRDADLMAWCKKREIDVVTSEDDYTLLSCDGNVKSGSGRPYAVFTPFYNKVMSEHVPEIPKVAKDDASPPTVGFVKGATKALASHAVDPATLVSVYLPSGPNKQLALVGGRRAGLERLANLGSFKNYQEERDFPFADKTTKLSPYLKFGCVSIREAFWSAVEVLGLRHGLVREIMWREFYAHVLFHNPHLVCAQVERGAKNMPFNEKYALFKWTWKDEHWEAFRRGSVGVPLVDAAVRCFNATGWCHNRCRMVIANFAVKVLGVDWRLCERWYATKAIDYDVASNNGGWLWSSGQGADAQPYFRTFNAFRQSERFDADCAFIKKWVPQLAAVPAKDIHSWDTAFKKHPLVVKEYPPGPIVNIKEMTKAVIDSFAQYK